MGFFMIKSMSKVEQNIDRVDFKGGESLYIIGTAHVSKKSAELVEKSIKELKPELIFLELDERRCQALKEKTFHELDIKKIIRLKQGYFFVAYLLLTLFQQKIAQDLDTEPGIEFKTALAVAADLKKKNPKLGHIALIDRPADITLKRLWRSLGFWKKCLLAFSGLASLFQTNSDDAEELSNEKFVEKMKEGDKLHSMLEDLGKTYPEVKRILIDERDSYMIENLLSHKKEAAFKKAIFVAGAGHVPGMLKYLKNKTGEPLSEEELKATYHALPPRSRFSFVVVWILPALILSIFAIGFFRADYSVLREALLYWVLVNGCFSALGAIFAGARPSTILLAFVAAPITSLNPSIGAGMVTSLYEVWRNPPRMSDFESLRHSLQKFSSVKVWRANRITKALLVFIFCSIGSAIGTFVALPFLLKIFS